MKATEQYSPVVLFIMLYKVGLNLSTKSPSVTLEMKPTKQYSSMTSMVLFIMQYKAVVTFDSVYEILLTCSSHGLGTLCRKLVRLHVPSLESK